MHRRDALLRMATAGATAAGATVIRSAPAFAYAAPMLVAQATLTTDDVNQRRLTVAITSVGTASCPGSAVSTSAGSYVRSDLAPIFVSSGAFLERLPPPSPRALFPTSVTTLAYDVRRTDANGPNRFQNGDSFSVTVYADFTCTYAGSSRTARLSSVRTLTFNDGVPGAWIVT